MADVYLYKAASAVSATEISGASDWPILVVTMDHGANHGTITGVKSGQDADMTITNGQIINGSGTATGWFTSTQSVTANSANLYQVHFHVSTQATTVDVAKTDWSTPKVIGSFGTVGTSGVRSSYFTIYHSAGSANSPGNPSATKFNFGNSTFTGLSSGWSTTAPQAVAGTTTSNYWYATVSAIEGKDGSGTPTGDTTGTGGNLTISNAFIGLAFTGLVTFNALSTSGSTTIHGANISTGTINANRIILGEVDLSQCDNTSSGFLTSHQSLAGLLTTTAFNTAIGSYATASALANGLALKQNAGSYLTTSTTDATNLTNFNALWDLKGIAFSSELTERVAADVNTEAGGAALSGTPIQKFTSALTASGLVLSSTLFDANGDIAGTFENKITDAGFALSSQVANFSADTIIQAGSITLRSNQSGITPSDSDNQILISAHNNQIVVRDGGSDRVIIGKLS